MGRKKVPSIKTKDRVSSLPSVDKIFLQSSSSLSEKKSPEKIVIKEKEEILFKTFIKTGPASVAVFDTHMCYLVASDRFLEETQSPTKDVIGKCHYDVVPDIPQRWKRAHARALKGETIKSEDAEFFERSEGRQEWHKWEICPWYKSDGDIGGMILFIEVVTEQKKLEIKMREAIKVLNRSNEELERFAHICAHDLNEPLRTIGNYCQLLAQDFEAELSLKTKIYIEKITKSVKQMGNLINGVLMYSQLEWFIQNRTKCSVQQIMDTVTMMLAEKIKEKKAMIQYEALPDVYGEGVLLMRVFQNLVSNALKFNQSAIPTIRVAAKESRQYVTFSVVDNGIGIKSKYHKEIFGLFKRLHTAQEYRGDGLGLAFCKKIVEAHGGKISVRSVPEGGSQFLISLPKMPQSFGFR